MRDEPGAKILDEDDYQRLLVLPPTRADAAAIEKLLNVNNILCEQFLDMQSLCAALEFGAGALLISEESLATGIDLLETCVRAQPVWSDLPIIVLSRSGVESVALPDLVRRVGNVSVVERPVRVSTLVSLIRSALRARERQCQVRDRLAEREQLLESERLAREEAERAGRMKDEFLATLSHELRTPLNAMLGWAQVLRNTPGLSSDLAEGLTVIDRNARSQAQIIEDLLDMSRIIAGKVGLKVGSIRLADVIDAAVETMKPTALTKGVHLQVDYDTENLSVSGDPGRLQQVFWNLLSNAVKFTPKGGNVAISVKQINTDLETTVADTGEGIDPDFLPHVFDRFRQADSTTTRRHGGLGLGLSIVKQLVEMHGGRITAESAGGGSGSTFKVLLPRSGDIEATTSPEIAKTPLPIETESSTPARVERRDVFVSNIPQTKEDLKGVAVLVVDDEPDARRLMRRLLEACDATVFTADSAAAAMPLLTSERPHVMVSDIGMPGEDGYALIQRVRLLPADRGGHTPAIALTAYARADDRLRAINAGFHRHLSKPVAPTELLKTISALARQV